MQDDDNYEVVPGTSFTVSRTAHRNNSSVYYIDARKSSFGEVTDVLKGKGIDLDNNRFLILQVNALPPMPSGTTAVTCQATGYPGGKPHADLLRRSKTL